MTDNIATKKCPDCAEDVRAEARKCRFCGLIFAELPESEPTPELPEAEPTSATVTAPEQLQTLDNSPRPLGRVTPTKVIYALLIVGLVVTYLKLSDGSRTQQNARDAPKEWQEQVNASERRTTPPANSSTAVSVGQTVTVLQMRPCSPTEDALSELVKWSVRHDETEFNRSMTATRSFAIEAGMRVKILDSGFGKRKIRVLTNNTGETYLKDEQGQFLADPRIGRQCWVNAEALQ